MITGLIMIEKYQSKTKSIFNLNLLNGNKRFATHCATLSGCGMTVVYAGSFAAVGPLLEYLTSPAHLRVPSSLVSQ